MKHISKKLLKYLAVILGTLSLMLVGALVFLHFTFKGMCGNEIFQTISSPNKKYKAIVFQRDCGATTGFSTQISILKTGINLANESGNIFTANGHPSDHPVKVTWVSDKKIEIKENFSESFLQNTTFKNIEIKYIN